jgi:hypothetical protein
MKRKDDARDQELDRILLKSEILPSSGFTASVMDAVRCEAAAPPPIPFPWKWALPGLVVCGVMLGLVVVVTVTQFASGAATTPLPAEWVIALRSLRQSTGRFGGEWVALALLASYACMKFSALFVPKRN